MLHCIHYLLMSLQPIRSFSTSLSRGCYKNIYHHRRHHCQSKNISVAMAVLINVRMECMLLTIDEFHMLKRPSEVVCVVWDSGLSYIYNINKCINPLFVKFSLRSLIRLCVVRSDRKNLESNYQQKTFIHCDIMSFSIEL